MLNSLEVLGQVLSFDFLVFHNYLPNSYLKIFDFVIKADIGIFLILRSYLEYFRVFKYEEYLRSFNPSLFRVFKFNITFLRPYPVFFRYKRSLYCSKILIYHAVLKNWMYGRLSFNGMVHYNNLSFIRFILMSRSIFSFKRNLFYYFQGNYAVFIYYSLYRSLLLSSKVNQAELDMESLDDICFIESYEDIVRGFFESFFTREFGRLVNTSSFYFYFLLFSIEEDCLHTYSFFYRLMYFFIYDYISPDIFIDLANYELRD